MKKALHLFDGFGVELEYMIVDKDELKVNPVADEVIKEVAGEYTSDIEFEELEWSNELVLHVIELKTHGPAKNLNGLSSLFHQDVIRINKILEKHNSMLVPTGAHPFMDPYTESKLWPHDFNPIYELYDRIFNCKGHGWSNLQSVHLNLPFYNDAEFEKLHSAIRILLPVIPAIAASTPILDGKFTGYLDTRLEYYRKNQIKIPAITGSVIPERIISKKEYEEKILEKIYSEISPYDADKILQYEWLNSRGAIARFDRNTIEIRIIDSQESPAAEIAIVKLISEALKKIIAGRWSTKEQQHNLDDKLLHKIFLNTIKTAEETIITDIEYLRVLGVNKSKVSAGDIWKHLYELITKDIDQSGEELLKPVEAILTQGTLAKRILKSLDGGITKNTLLSTYRDLSDCLNQNKIFIP
jgi:gamma-glutamyl:cysteine ligase YbdK (ATP-grasp superfamily)